MERFPRATVYASQRAHLTSLLDRMGVTPETPVEGDEERMRLHYIQEGEEESLFNWPGVDFTAKHTQGHTQDCVSYLVETDSEAVVEDPFNKYSHHRSSSALFSGDALFPCGCGRLFDGSAQQMQDSFDWIRTSTEPETLVLSGHEYTQ
ncbi:hypothetical protein KIPB_010529, partial [Kipferlia bialata]|eukprot:g10529.t1